MLQNRIEVEYCIYLRTLNFDIPTHCQIAASPTKRSEINFSVFSSKI